MGKNNPLGLDPRKMKVKSVDKNFTTLQHIDGHEIRIAHNILSPAAKAALKSFGKTADNAMTSTQAQEKENMTRHLADGGKINSHKNQELYKKGVEEIKKKDSTPEQKQKNRDFFDRADEVLKGKKSRRIPMEIGGVVPAPDTKDTSESVQQKNKREAKEGAEKGPSVPSASEMASRLLHPWAEGGQICSSCHAKGGQIQKKDAPKEVCMACGGPVQHNMPSNVTGYADGGDIGGVADIVGQQPAEQPMPIGFSSAPTEPEFNEMGQHNPAYGGMGLDTSAVSNFLNAPRPQYDRFGNPQQPQVTPQAVAATQAQADADQANYQAEQADLVARAAQQNASQVPQQQQPQAAKQPGQFEMPSFQQGIQQQIQGMNELAKAQGNLGQAQAQAMAKQADDQQRAMNEFHANWKQLNDERQAHIQDLQNSHIDPDQYWEGHTDEHGNKVGGHSKVMSAIGMILGGFNPTNSPNAAMDFLNKQIDRNLQAQKENLGMKKSLLEHNIQQFGNLQNGLLATRVFMNDMIANELNKQAALAANPMEASRAKIAAGQLIQQTAPMAMKLSIMQAVGKLSSADPHSVAPLIAQAKIFDPELGKSLSDAYVPNVGVSATMSPIPQEEKQKIAAYHHLFDMMGQAINFKKTHPGAALSIEDRAVAGTLMSSLADAIRQAGGMGVFKQSEQENIQSMIGRTPAGFFSGWHTDPKLTEMLKLKQLEYSNLLKSYSLPQPAGFQQAPSPGQSSSMEGKIIRSKQTGQSLIMRHGRWTPYNG